MLYNGNKGAGEIKGIKKYAQGEENESYEEPLSPEQISSVLGGAWDWIKDTAGKAWNAAMEALLQRGIHISSVVSKISDIVEPYVKDNYDSNSKYIFSDYIYDQTAGAAAEQKMGYYTGTYNGCGWVAAYNAARVLGKDSQPCDIINYFDSRGGALVNGAFGVNPLAVKQCFEDQGANAEMYSLPSDIDTKIGGSKASILAYIHNRGTHYVAIKYKNGKYYAYNLEKGHTDAEDFDSIDALLNQRKFITISLITIS